MSYIVTEVFQWQDFCSLPLDERKRILIDDKKVSESVKNGENHDPLIQIFEDDTYIKIAPFWNDASISLEDEELGYILNLEMVLLREYIAYHPSFGISVRQSVYEKLLETNESLKKYHNYEMQVKIGYRPIEVQKQLFSHIYEYFSWKHSNLSSEEVYTLSCQYVSDSDRYPSPHTTGGAVDIIIIDSMGNPVDMGSPINYPGEISHIGYEDISEKQKANRNVLIDTMLSCGFASLASEWWHFSYGDTIWAYFYGKKESLFSPIVDETI